MAVWVGAYGVLFLSWVVCSSFWGWRGCISSWRRTSCWWCSSWVLFWSRVLLRWSLFWGTGWGTCPWLVDGYFSCDFTDDCLCFGHVSFHCLQLIQINQFLVVIQYGRKVNHERGWLRERVILIFGFCFLAAYGARAGRAEWLVGSRRRTNWLLYSYSSDCWLLPSSTGSERLHLRILSLMALYNFWWVQAIFFILTRRKTFLLFFWVFSWVWFGSSFFCFLIFCLRVLWWLRRCLRWGLLVLAVFDLVVWEGLRLGPRVFWSVWIFVWWLWITLAFVIVWRCRTLCLFFFIRRWFISCLHPAGEWSL